MDVDTRLLRYFVVVAEELSFTRAAKRLYVAQPSLSRQIRQLEARLGADLFTRTSSAVALTAAGRALLPAARRQVAEWQESVRLVRTAAAAERNVLRIGFAATGGGDLARRARSAFTRRYPGVTVEPKRFEWGGEARAVRDGLADVAYVWLPAELDGLCSEVVATERRWVAVKTTHPLASREEVGIGDLRDEPLMWTRVAPPEWVDWWAVNPRPDGSEPVWGPENANVEEMLEHVATTSGVCIGPESMKSFYVHPDLTWRPVVDIEPLRIALAWPEHSANALVHAFVEIVRRLA
ncbi:DNA-binding transcriptional regulator, LysR family [Lentzea xinjiangensis]|uniref:DNA-binding transcriptional regulator, LysR family n=1 Tax=Lentzea xinjiangensis TaxID=402600 RepID=A0A1H9VM33_9PSEU|nr:LysR family transcriptional regulator [Lentzea xinjiangensis]SES22639.1 DNA-binding transcriptional regulator, LysR family [Lentzea xinjiangensis]